MRVGERHRTIASLLGLLFWFLFTPHSIHAEQLPIKTYTTSEGLVRDNVNRIVRDSHGFLWFCTEEGLSRFDGYQFTNYTTDQGLPHRWVNDLLETRDGSYWVATGDGVCRFNPMSASLFLTYHLGQNDSSRQVEVMVEDNAGVIWCGTHGGLYRLEAGVGNAHFQFVDMGMPVEGGGNVVHSIVADRQGALWVGTEGSGLYRRLPDGRAEHYSIQNELPDNRVEAMLEDHSGRLWVGTTSGLCQLVLTPAPNRSVVDRLYTMKDGLASNFIESLFQSADDNLWVGDGGLSQFIISSGKNSQQFRTFTTDNGLSSPFVQTIAEDGDGNLWLGTDSGGAMKLGRRGFTTYTEADGLAASGADAVFEDRAGELCVISSGTKHFINRFDGQRFTAVWPTFPKQITNFGWGWNQITLQDRAGEWWIPTGQGLCRFPAVADLKALAHTSPKKVYTTRQGLPFNDVFRLYEDSHGDIWISTLSRQSNGLSRWERASETLHNFSEADGLVSLTSRPAASFGEDAEGNLWIGHWTGGLSRYAGGRFTYFDEAAGLPAGTIRAVYLDHAHRLWIASSVGGLARIDNPATDRPSFLTYTTADGLSSNDVWCITEDQWGHIYIGTGRGLDRLDPDSGHINHYTSADGLMRGKVTSAFRDKHGDLWFCSNVHGLSRLVPGTEPVRTPPPVLISQLRIAGVTYPLSQLGEREMPSLDLSPNQNQVTIDFVGICFAPGEVLRYQYQLDGSDQDWSPPSDQRSVNFANLASGHYRFRVRAVNAEGIISDTPATFTFTILPPIWRRWWFLSLLAIFIGIVIYAAHRRRVAQLLAIERVRMRLATDLHDDIGANLSLIAMLSEVAHKQLPGDDRRMKEWFSTIAATSRDTVDAMSDIVWAVNPRRDQLRDLTQRMRRFADDYLVAQGIELHFYTPELSRDLKVGADLRREVFLIFKESINNMVRHSRCKQAFIELQIVRGWIVLQMRDDGKGFNLKSATDGNGLNSICLRAKKLGGSLEVDSLDGQGTSVILKVPLDYRGSL